MDPKHQFAAQYVLSRAAAERREREILASSSLGIKQTDVYVSLVECVNVKKSSGVKTVVLLESTTLHDADNPCGALT